MNVQIGEAGVDQAFHVFPVQNRVIGLKPQQRGMAAQNSIPDVMKGSSPHLAPYAASRGDQRLNPVKHLAGRFVGERNEQDIDWIHAGFDQIGDPIGHDAGFPASRTGDD